MFDRIGRRSAETPFVVEWFIKHGICVISVKEGEQILDSHTDRLLNYIRYWQGEGKPALLFGILFCGTCGHRLSTSRPAENSRRNKTQYVCPICRKTQLIECGQYTYTAETVDSMVLRQTSTLLNLFTTHSEASLRKTLVKKRKAAFTGRKGPFGIRKCRTHQERK